MNRVIKKINEHNTTDRLQGCGRIPTACTEEKMGEAEELLLLKDGREGTHFSQMEVAHHLHISKSAVKGIKKKLGLKSVKRLGIPQMIYLHMDYLYTWTRH